MGASQPSEGGGTGGSNPQGGLTENMACALTYLLGFITGILFLVLEPYNKNKLVRFHAFQSIFVSVAFFIIQILLGMLGVFTVGFSLLLSPLVALAGFVLWLYLMIQSYQGKKVVLPMIGPIAEQQA